MSTKLNVSDGDAVRAVLEGNREMYRVLVRRYFRHLAAALPSS